MKRQIIGLLLMVSSIVGVSLGLNLPSLAGVLLIVYAFTILCTLRCLEPLILSGMGVLFIISGAITGEPLVL
jgi:hypothetical protein